MTRKINHGACGHIDTPRNNPPREAPTPRIYPTNVVNFNYSKIPTPPKG